MSIRPTDVKEPIYETDSDLTESEIKEKGLKKYYLLLSIFLAIDLVITIFVILHESNIFSEKENNLVFLIVNLVCFTAFSLFVFTSISLYKVCLSKVVKYLHIILTMLYFGYLLITKIIYLVKNFKNIGVLDLIFFFLFLLSIMPRIFFYVFIRRYIVLLMEKNEAQRGEEHEDFRQNLENKMERGDNTNWSKTSLPSELKRASN